MQATIALLPGDGVGPEVVTEARKTLEAVSSRFGHDFAYATYLIGGVAIDETGQPLPAPTVTGCGISDAILLGAVGGPKWDNPAAETRPEAGLLAIRQELGLYANLRPVRPNRNLVDTSPLRPELVMGVDILFVRELTGGIYFGPEGFSNDPPGAYSTMAYTEHEVERIVRVAAQAARNRSGRLTSVDKANVLEVSRLWRRVAERVVTTEFPDIEYDVVLVDAMAMHLISRPRDFDVVVTGNMFGDILTDEASMLPGSLGLLPSASLGEQGPGLYEPIHGSAPDIAGRGIANPLAAIAAAAMALRHSLALEAEAATVEAAIDSVLDSGLRTVDIALQQPTISTAEMGDAVAREITRSTSR